MNSRTGQIIRNKVTEYEESADVPVDADALWERLSGRPLQPDVKRSRVNNTLAAAVALLVMCTAIVFFLIGKEEPVKELVRAEPVTESPKPVATAAGSETSGAAEKVPVVVARMGKEAAAAKPRHKTTACIDPVTEYLKNMDIPSMAGLYAGKEDMLNPEDEYYRLE